MSLKIVAAFVAALLAAIGLFTPNATPNPIEAARLNNLGCAYMNQQLFEKALKQFQQAAEADPKLAIARLNQGIAELNLQKMDEAKSALDDVLKQDPKNPNAWYNLGLMAKNAGDAQGAIDDFKRVTEIDPTDADTWYFLGTAYVQAKRFPPAIEAFQHALQINPLHASAEFGLSRAYQQSADVDHAREHLKKFQYITQNKIGSPMSLTYGEQGQYSRVVESPQAQLKPPDQIKVQFVDVTSRAGIGSGRTLYWTHEGPQYLGPGACFIDYDNDGKIDLFMADGGPAGGMALYHNLGNGKFQHVATQAGIGPAKSAIGCTAGDFDNDGYQDLVVSFDDFVRLFHNEKGSGFKDMTSEAGLSQGFAGYVYGLTFVDYDHDGDIDLHVGRTSVDSGPVVTVTTPSELDSKPQNAQSARQLGSARLVLGISANSMWRNNGNGTFVDVANSLGLGRNGATVGAIGSDFNNDRAVDLIATRANAAPLIYQNQREGEFSRKENLFSARTDETVAVAALDFDHDGWMDYAFTQFGAPGLTLWRNNHGKSFDQVKLPETNWVRAYGVAAFDYDNDGWVDLVAVGETKDGKGEVRLFRNRGPDGFKDVTTDVGLDKIHLESPRAIITGDYDNDGATDLLITQNHGPAVLLRNEGGNQNHWLRLALKGLNDNKSAIGTKVEVFSGGNRQKLEIYGSNGYLGQNSPYLTVGLGDAKEADIVRMLWPTGVLQDEIHVGGDKQQDILEIDRRGSSCPTLFVWNGERYQFVADMLGAGVVGHWVGPGQRDIPRPVEYIKIPTGLVREKENLSNSQTACHPERSEGPVHLPASCTDPSPHKTAAQDDEGRLWGRDTRTAPTTNARRPTTVLSFRFMEPLEEAVYLDQVRLLAVDHPADVDVFPNEYFASNPPYPPFKVVVSRDARPPAGAWDDHGHDVLPDLLARRYFGDFALTPFLGFAKPHTLTLDLGQPYDGGPLWLLMHGEVEYFSANSMYAAAQAGITAIAPNVETLGSDGNWKRVIDDMGFPAGGPRTITVDLTRRLPQGTRKIRLTTNLQIYWDSILVSRTDQGATRESHRPAGESAGLRDDAGSSGSESLEVRHPERSRSSGEAKDRARTISMPTRVAMVPLVRADLESHGYPLKIEGTPPGNVNYIYEKASATGPYTRPFGSYTRYGDVLPLLIATDDKLAVFGSGDEVRLDFDPSNLRPLPAGWVRDYFFAANGYEKDMDFYAAEGNFVAPLPFLSMGEYPYPPKKSFPLDDAHVNYLLEYNTRHMSGNEQGGYWFDYGSK
jgi:tetratricopeptide (TPR) repeat protein